MKHKRLIINAACAMLLIGCSLTAYAFADSATAITTGPGVKSPETSGSQTDGSSTGAADKTNQLSTQKGSNVNGQGGLKLNANNLNQCEHQQTEINFIQRQIVTRTTNQITLFSTVTQRVETFANSKNLNVPNYASLANKLTTDQSVVSADLTSLHANQTLDCSGSDPTGTLQDFKANIENMFTDMQTYKSDVLKLIVAVKSVAEPKSAGSQTKPVQQGSATSGSQTGGNEE